VCFYLFVCFTKRSKAKLKQNANYFRNSIENRLNIFVKRIAVNKSSLLIAGYNIKENGGIKKDSSERDS